MRWTTRTIAPVCIVVPCHRVIGKNGELKGYAGGVIRKHRLLEHEGALPAADAKPASANATAVQETMQLAFGACRFPLSISTGSRETGHRIRCLASPRET